MTTAKDLFRRFQNIGTIPPVAIRLTRLINDPNSTLKSYEELIRLDPTLVLRVLRLANSAYYGLPQKIDSISRALVFIGIKNLRNMVVTEALKRVYKRDDNNEIFSKSRLWLHCAVVGICSQMISERIFAMKGEDAFLSGILHDIGMIVEEQVATDDFIEACTMCRDIREPITQCERSKVGTDHCEIGFLVAQDWQLPETVQTGIQNHHRSFCSIEPSSIAGILQLAEFLAIKMDYASIEGMPPVLSPPLAAHVKERLGEYKALVKKLPEVLDKAMEIYRLDVE